MGSGERQVKDRDLVNGLMFPAGLEAFDSGEGGWILMDE